MGAKLTKSEGVVSKSEKATDATTNGVNRPAEKRSKKIKPSKEQKVRKITAEKGTNTDGYVFSSMALEEQLVGDRLSTDNPPISTHTTTSARINSGYQPEIANGNDVDSPLVHSGILPMEFHLRHEHHRDDARPTTEP